VFVNNQDLERQIAECRADSGAKATSNELGRSFLAIAEQVWFRSPSPYLDKEDFTQQAALCCLTQLHTWDQDKGVAFNYFMTVCNLEFRFMLRTAQREQAKKRNYYHDLSD
jgi:hypothetical protein